MGYYDSFDCEIQCEDFYQNEEAFFMEEEEFMFDETDYMNEAC